MTDRFTLKRRIDDEVAGFDGRMSVYVNDLMGTTVERDADEPFETASCIKSYILACLFERIEHGKAALSDMIVLRADHVSLGSGVLNSLEVGSVMSVGNLARLMIIVSDNTATNMLIEYLSLAGINDYIKSAGFVNTELFNLLDFENYDRLGTTTPRDYGHLFEQLAAGTLVSKKASEAMKNIYADQHYRTILCRELPPNLLDSEDTGEPELIKVYSKSGSMSACRNDGGIVETPFGSYVAVIFTKDFADPIFYDGHPAYSYGARVSRLIFENYINGAGRLDAAFKKKSGK